MNTVTMKENCYRTQHMFRQCSPAAVAKVNTQRSVLHWQEPCVLQGTPTCSSCQSQRTACCIDRSPVCYRQHPPAAVAKVNTQCVALTGTLRVTGNTHLQQSLKSTHSALHWQEPSVLSFSPQRATHDVARGLPAKVAAPAQECNKYAVFTAFGATFCEK